MLEDTFIWGIFVTDSSKTFPNFFPVGLYTTRELAMQQLESMSKEYNYHLLKMPINKDFSYYHRKSGKLVGMDGIHHEHYHFLDESK
ncbi:hypothetical protein [Paenibacillus sp. MMO-58]|uniref:hypothetical protein n=1 Tax=Paenibacillus sp. MMO-58 TaxID=3081290 RepID=UPI003019FB54